jgi:ABC-2 type transport system permease protein
MPVFLIVISWLASSIDSPASDPVAELAEASRPEAPIGYVDQAGVIEAIPDPVPQDLFKPFSDVEAARAALERGDVAAYYVVLPDYVETGRVQRVSPQIPTLPPDTEWFDWVLLSNLFPETSLEEVAHLRQPLGPAGPGFVLVGAAEEEGGGTGNTILPTMVTIAVIIPLFTSGSYLFQSLAQEKGNRVMEILLVSLRPRQLLIGKLLGLGALTFVQYVIWIVISGMGLTLTGQDALQMLSQIRLSTGELALIIPYALGGYLLYAAVMAGVGALSSDMESSRTWVFIFSLPMLIPFYLSSAIASAPNGDLATALSLIPFSAPVAMLMRMTSTALPTWQVVVSLVLLALTGLGLVLLMARLFRAQVLLSGESFSLERFWATVRSPG